jgi:ribosomal protein L5
VSEQQGLDITIVTTANDNEAAFQLLKLMGMPFAEK